MTYDAQYDVSSPKRRRSVFTIILLRQQRYLLTVYTSGVQDLSGCVHWQNYEAAPSFVLPVIDHLETCEICCQVKVVA